MFTTPRFRLTPFLLPPRAQFKCIKLHQNAAHFTRKPSFPLPTLPPAPGAKRTHRFFLPPWLPGSSASHSHAKAPQSTPTRPNARAHAKRTAMSAALSREFFKQRIFGLRNWRRCATSIFSFRRLASAMPVWIGRGRPAPTPHPLKRTRSFHTAIRGVCS